MLKRRFISISAVIKSFHASASRSLYLCTHPDIMPARKVSPIPLFDDNYCWKVLNEVSNEAVCVDPANAPEVLQHFGHAGPDFAGILITHKHWDHAGGTEDLVKAKPGLQIYAGELDSHAVKAVTHRLKHGDTFSIAGFKFTVLHTPCHTAGHVCYLMDGASDEPSAVFTGDTLFCGGCGKFFEGDASTMLHSLSILKALPSETLVYCGHEYTQSNLEFCAHVEPENVDIQRRLENVRATRERGECTVPSTIQEELNTNVFMRTDKAAVRSFVSRVVGHEVEDEVEVLHHLRAYKNSWKKA